MSMRGWFIGSVVCPTVLGVAVFCGLKLYEVKKESDQRTAVECAMKDQVFTRLFQATIAETDPPQQLLKALAAKRYLYKESGSWNECPHRNYDEGMILIRIVCNYQANPYPPPANTRSGHPVLGAAVGAVVGHAIIGGKLGAVAGAAAGAAVGSR